MQHWFYNRAWALLLTLFAGVAGFAQGSPNDHIFPAAASARPFIDFDTKGFLIHGQRTFLVSAGIEYARVPRALWADRLLRLKRAGFNCVEIYTFWSFHEPREGVFDFTGDHDLGAFLQLVKRVGMYAIVRVGPYYCAEWDNGGYPLWLKFKPGLRVREPNAVFESAVGHFFDRLLPIVAANQINHGGAVILVQLENEHPQGWGTAMPNSYFTWLRNVALAHGIEVPYFFSGLHHDSDPAGDRLNLDDPGRPNPWMTTEFWSVWYNGYGSGPAEASLFERRTWKIIAHGGNGYNYYMAHGGSNFGYTNNDEDAASYDYGAAVGQGGDLRPIYYAFKRAAFFARSFASLLENSAGDTVRGAVAGGVHGVVAGDSVRVNERRGPSGDIVFLDNASSLPARVVVGVDTVMLAPGEIFPYVRKFGTLKGNTLRIFGIVGHTLIVYGATGEHGRLHFSSGELAVTVGPTVGTYRVGGWRVLVMDQEMADRTWVVDDKIICGPAYVGAFAAGRMETEGDGNALVFTANDVVKYVGGVAFSPMETKGDVRGWMKGPDGGASGSAGDGYAAVDYDDAGWKGSEWPLQMGADGDTTADAWYRVHLAADSTGDYTLLVEGADRARAFLDGVSMGPVAIKDGVIPLHLTHGRHLLAVFTAHDGRDKLPAYLGPLDSVARKGLYGRALLVRGAPAVTVLSGWKMSKDSMNWGPYTIGDDAFDKKPGRAWFRAELPAVAPGVRQAELRFASVDENAAVFVNGRRLAYHAGWNAPFNVLIDRIDTFTRPVVLTVFVENYSNEGGIDQSVRFSPWLAPVPVKGWKMRGGPGVAAGAATVAADTAGPCWWHALFTVPADSGYSMVWRVIPTGLGHGSIWVNGHNLGRYPEKIPVNGLYIPGCWLRAGSNDLLIYDEDGRNAGQVTVEAETGASRRFSVLTPSAEYGFVDPFIGTTKSAVFTRWGDEGGTYPGAVAPSGFVQLTPETRRGGYDYRDSSILGFSCWDHHSGFPGGSGGRLFVMAVPAGSDGAALHGRLFSHADEVAGPGYYRVRLTDDGTVVEAAATPLAGVFRIWFGGLRHEVFVSDTAGARFGFSEPALDSRAVDGGTIYRISGRMVEVWVGERIDFDSAQTATRRAWERALRVVEIADDDARRKTVFYTALYHSLLLPWVVDDSGGYGGFSPWDAFRSLHPLLTLLYPEKQAGVLRSLMAEYRRSGYLPTESMTGNHSIPILVDSWLKGIQVGDRAEVYSAMLKSLVRGPFMQRDMHVFLDSGYIPFTHPESVTRTVEYGYDDWVLAQYAGKVMGDTTMYRSLMRRATAYRRLLYVPSLLLLPRDGDSVRVRPGNSGYKEGDAWVYTYFAPQDVAGLIHRLGGPAFFCSRLESALRDGRIVFDNETVEHVPYLFSYAGRADLTQYWVRKIMDERYSDQPGGLPGNDDLGAMSSWYVFSALGFYPVCPGDPVYTLGAPVFRHIVVHLAGGRSLVIVADEGKYVRAVRFNGEPWRKTEVPHAMIAQGGRLVFAMGASPEVSGAAGSRIAVAGFVVSRMTGVRPAGSAVELTSGEWGMARFILRNSGDTGVMRVSLFADGKLLTAKNVMLPAGAQVRDSLAFRMYRLGPVTLRLGGLDARVTVVKPARALPAEPTAEELDLRAVVRRGDSMVVRYVLKNTGWEAAEYRVPLLVDSTVVAVDTVKLEPGEGREQVWVWKASVAGWHEWRVGGLSQRFRVYASSEEAVVLDGVVMGDTAVRDGSGWGNALHVAGAAGDARGEAGQGLAVGRNRYLWVAANRTLNDLGERLTMCVWVYPEAAKNGLVDIFTNGDTHVLQIGGGRTLTFFAGGWGRGDCTVDLPGDWLRHWHLLAGVCDEGGLRLYIDGQLRGTTKLEKSVHLFGGGNTWMIGRNEEFPGERIFEGRVDRPRIYQEALGMDAIHDLYEKEREQP